MNKLYLKKHKNKRVDKASAFISHAMRNAREKIDPWSNRWPCRFA